jgi:hypothetical protein
MTYSPISDAEARVLLIILGTNTIIMMQIRHWIGLTFGLLGILLMTLVIISYKEHKKTLPKEEN